MKIDGLDYNTQREALLMTEYGREIQQMVDCAISIPDRKERQRCAETIINIMDRMSGQKHHSEDHEQKLWDHLALISGFRLDIDYPFDIAKVAHLSTKPEPLTYPMKDIPVRHYGHLVFQTFEKLKTMPDGEERDKLVQMIATQMKRDLLQWGHGTPDTGKVASDLAHYTDGKIQISSDFLNRNEKYSTDKRRKKN